jgi:2-polyprenyl-3-methyl-5-hydroxy-6-metoxy-1,4-benzoquinol methylase
VSTDARDHSNSQAHKEILKYYYREHLAGYARCRAENKTSWAEIHGEDGFEQFASRAFLEEVLPKLLFSGSPPTVLELGCGTGPGACFLAERGFRVDAIDLIPTAIEIARQQSQLRGLQIRYTVQDVTTLPHDGPQYDLIVDSYCLQGIVTDADRRAVYAAVRARLKPDGTYLVSSAMHDPARFQLFEVVIDDATGTVYHRYGDDGLIDPQTGIVYVPLGGDCAAYEGTRQIAGRRYLLNRRHHRPAALRAELEGAGFRVLYQDGGYGGNLVCVLS